MALHRPGQRGFTLIELMVVFAMIAALSMVFLMDIGATMGKTHSVQHVRDIHALARASLALEDALKATPNAVTGGNMVIQAAFPHGGITQTGNSFTSAIGTSITVSWNQGGKELSIINTVVPQADCIDVLKSVDASSFTRIVVAAGATSNTLSSGSWPITLATASGACPAADASLTFVLKL